MSVLYTYLCPVNLKTKNMKKTFTKLFLLMSMPFAGMAQITLTTSDFPGMNEAWYQYTDTSTHQAVGTSGTNQNWNFTNFVADENSGIMFTSPSNAPASWSSNFPNATYVSYSPYDTNATYFRSGTNGFYIDGFYDGRAGAFPGLLDFNPDQLIIPTPFTYNSTRTHRARFVLYTTNSGYDIEFVQGINQNLSGDAYGTLTTPAGTFSNTLRIKDFQFIDDSILVDFFGTGNYQLYQAEGPKDTAITYRWFQHAPQTLLFEIEERINGATPSGIADKASFWSTTPSPLSAKTINTEKSVAVYPNPANNSQYITFNLNNIQASNIAIYNAAGQMVKNAKINGSTMLMFDTVLFESGMYFYHLTNSQGQKMESGKFVVTK